MERTHLPEAVAARRGEQAGAAGIGGWIVVAVVLLLASAPALPAQAPPEGSGEVEAIIAGLASEDVRVRRNAARQAHALGPDAAGAVAALGEAYGTNDQTTRTWVVRALEAIGPPATESVPVLLRALESDEARTIRLEAARALRAVGVSTSTVVEALARSVVEEEDGSNRQAALEALGSFGPAAGAAFPVIHDALGDRLFNVREAAAAALGELGPVALDALPDLEEVAASDALVRVRRAAAASTVKLHAAAENPPTDPARDAGPPRDIADHEVPTTSESTELRAEGTEMPTVRPADPAQDDAHSRVCGNPTAFYPVDVSASSVVSGSFASSIEERWFLVRFRASGMDPKPHTPTIRMEQDLPVYVMDLYRDCGRPLTACGSTEPVESVTAWSWDDRQAVHVHSTGQVQRRCPFPEAVLVRVRRVQPSWHAVYRLTSSNDPVS